MRGRIRNASVVAIGLLGSAATVSCTGGTANSSDIFVISYHQHIDSQLLGFGQDIVYKSEILPDPQHKDEWIGDGSYSGSVVYHKVNCHNFEVDYADEVTVSGALQASGSLVNVTGTPLGGTSVSPGDQITFILATTDWPLLPLVFGRNYFAKTPDEKDAAKGLGTVNDFGVALTGNTTTVHRSSVISHSDCTGDVTETVDETIERIPNPDKLKAIPSISDGKQRAGLVALDGSASTPVGGISSYSWTISPGPDCPAGVTSATINQKIARIAPLCSMTAKLTVSKGSQKDSTTDLPVKVVARNWHTGFVHDPTDSVLVNKKLLYPCLLCQFGRNVCTQDGITGDQTSGGHMIHKDPASVKWLSFAYTVDPLDDPSGIFAGWWYVSQNSLAVTRTSLVNYELDKSGPIYTTNKLACRAQQKATCDIDVVLAAVSAHERMHSTLLKEQLDSKGGDPAPLVEPVFGPPGDQQKVSDEAEQHVALAETALIEATTDAKVVARLQQNADFNKPGAILLPDTAGVYQTFNISNFALMGE